MFTTGMGQTSAQEQLRDLKDLQDELAKYGPNILNRFPTKTTLERRIRPSMEEREAGIMQSMFDLRVEKIENGMIVHIAFSEGEKWKRFYIGDLAELPELITAQMAAHKIGV